MTRDEILTRAAAAQVLGHIAFTTGISAPALDPQMMELLTGCKVGEGLPILKAWNKGWTLANLSDDYEWGGE